MALMYAFVQIKQLGGVCSRAAVYAARNTKTSARIEEEREEEEEFCVFDFAQ